MIGRYKGFHIGTEYDVDYGFDSLGRFNSVSNGTDTFTYAYLANSNLVSTLTMPHDITVNNSYEPHRNLITSVENKYSTTTVSKYDYVNDAIGRRTSMAKSGTAFTQTDTISYGYNDRSEITSATATNDSNYNFGFAFDNIGNRSVSTDGQESRSYTSNNLNQYTAITNPTRAPTYDDDGNMLTNGDWTYTWNAENRLISAVNGTTVLEFKYDYMGRRVEKKVTENSTVTKHEYFVYDDYELIEVLNALDSSSLKQKFIWGDGLVAVTDGSNVYYYFRDANKNVGQLIDSSGNIVSKYEYSPFGKQVVSNGSYTNNPFRFSSEYYDSETDLLYYNYRYYSAELGRWISRDPIEEKGGFDLYGMVNNNPVNWIDYLGLECPCNDGANKKKEKKNGYQEAGSLILGGAITTQVDTTLPGPADVIGIGIMATGVYLGAKQLLSDLAGYLASYAISEITESFSKPRGKGERNYDRKNPNPNKTKTRDPQTGKKLPKKPAPKPRPPEPPLVPKRKPK